MIFTSSLRPPKLKGGASLWGKRETRSLAPRKPLCVSRKGSHRITGVISAHGAYGHDACSDVSVLLRPGRAADGLKSERKVCVLRIDFFRARKWPTITASNISNAPTAWDTQNNTQYHTPDANMTSLIIRHDRTDERGCQRLGVCQDFF